MNRRQFIEATGLVGASYALTTDGGISNLIEREKASINIGVIGTGSRGGGMLHLMKDIDSLNVVACCDILPYRLTGAMRDTSTQSKSYSDYRQLLDDKSVDAVYIATPLHLHSEMAINALDAGKHVYCEKTLAYNVTQTRDMVNHAKFHEKLKFQVGYQYRNSKLFQNISKLVSNGYIGRVTGFQCQWNRNGNWRRAVADAKDERIINWRMYREYSGGLLAELASHQIDFVNSVLGMHPISVVGTGGIDYWKDGRETFDNVHAIFDYPDGVKASFTCLTANALDGFQIKILGDKAAILLKPDIAYFYPEEELINTSYGIVDGVSGATVGIDDLEAIPIEIEQIDPSKQALLDFADTILFGQDPLSDVRTASIASLSVHMALQAIREQKTVAWTDL